MEVTTLRKIKRPSCAAKRYEKVVLIDVLIDGYRPLSYLQLVLLPWFKNTNANYANVLVFLPAVFFKCAVVLQIV